MVPEMLDDPGLKRIANFASQQLKILQPMLYNKYKAVMDVVYANDKSLIRNFEGSVFPAATLNFGPLVLTVKHRDSQNKAEGMCSITSLGKFDYTEGGHLILYDLGLAIQFPAGSTILIPLALLSHGNIAFKPGSNAQRMSFTQYMAGGLFRWVRLGFRLRRDASEALNAEVDAEAPTAWEEALKHWKAIDSTE